LLKNPERYNGKVIRTRAVFRRAGEEIAEFYCPKCLDLRRVYFDISEDYKYRTNPEVRNKLLKERTFNVILTARFQVAGEGKGFGHFSQWHYKFVVSRIERADIIFTGGTAPESLSKRVIRRARCL
jgi:hypothetical protein